MLLVWSTYGWNLFWVWFPGSALQFGSIKGFYPEIWKESPFHLKDKLPTVWEGSRNRVLNICFLEWKPPKLHWCGLPSSGISSSKEGRLLWKQYPKSHAGYEINTLTMGLFQYFGLLRNSWLWACAGSCSLCMNKSEGLEIQSSMGELCSKWYLQ